jgi:hypothetical protein
MDRTIDVLESIFGLNNQIPFDIFTKCYDMKEFKICTCIIKYMKSDNEYVKRCIDCLSSHFLEPLELLELLGSFESTNFDKDEFGNNIENIELIKWLLISKMYKITYHINRHINYEHWIRDILQKCIFTGVLDLVKICYVHLDINKHTFFDHFVYAFFGGHKNIMKWMYENDELNCKLDFDTLFGLINSNNGEIIHQISGVIMDYEKYQHIINCILEICDEVKLETYCSDDGTMCLPQQNVILMMSKEEYIWKKSLRCSWLTACETIANLSDFNV